MLIILVIRTWPLRSKAHLEASKILIFTSIPVQNYLLTEALLFFLKGCLCFSKVYWTLRSTAKIQLVLGTVVHAFRDRQEDTRLDSKRPCLKHKKGVGVGCHGWQRDCLACTQAWVQFPAPHTLGICDCDGRTPTRRKETGGSVQGQP